VVTILQSRAVKNDLKRQEASYKALTFSWEPASAESEEARLPDLYKVLQDAKLPGEFRIVLGWRALEEKMMTTTYGATRGDSRGRPIGSVISNYAKRQSLGEDDVFRLRRIVNFRNRAAHGGNIEETSAELDEMIGDIVRYLSDNG
jgi:hypothetical protein